MDDLGVTASILKTTDFVITRLDPITVPMEWIHQCDIAWASWHLKSRTTRLFAQQLLILRLTDENLKVQHYWPFVKKIHQCPIDCLCKGPVMWKTCHGIIKLWSVLLHELTLGFLHCWPFYIGFPSQRVSNGEIFPCHDIIYPATMTSSILLPWHHLSCYHDIIYPATMTSSILLPWHHLYCYHGIIYPATMTSSILLPWHHLSCYHDIIYPATMASSILLPWHHLSCYHDIIYPATMTSSILLPWHHLSCYHDIIYPATMTSSILLSWHHLSCYHDIIYPATMISSILLPWHHLSYYHDIIYPATMASSILLPSSIVLPPHHLSSYRIYSGLPPCLTSTDSTASRILN